MSAENAGEVKATIFSFGGPSQPTTSGGIFGAPASGSGGLFGAQAADGGGIFGSAPSSGGLFGAAPAGGSLFGGTAGGLFGGASAPAAAGGGGDDEEGDGLVKDEEVTIVTGWAPSITLEVQETIATGEENEDIVFEQRSKLYRFKDNEWKERGLGDARILKHKETGKVRFLMRQEKSGKIVANHVLLKSPPYCELRPNAESGKIWCWSALDCAEDDQVKEEFALKFGQEENATKFKETFEAARDGKDVAIKKKAVDTAVPED